MRWLGVVHDDGCGKVGHQGDGGAEVVLHAGEGVVTPGDTSSNRTFGRANALLEETGRSNPACGKATQENFRDLGLGAGLRWEQR
jgi:hypothetical protein